MNRFITSALLSAFTAASLASIAHAQSTTSDPLGINAIEDTSIQRQRGSLQGGTNSSLGVLRDGFRNQDTISGWSFDGGDIILRDKNKQ